MLTAGELIGRHLQRQLELSLEHFLTVQEIATILGGDTVPAGRSLLERFQAQPGLLPRFRETIVTLLSEFLPVQPVGELAQIFLDHADRPEFEVREVYRTLPRLREVLGRRLEETRPLAVPQAFCDTIRRGMVYVGATRWLTLPPEVTQGFLERARAKLGSAGGAGVAVVVPDQDVRRPVCSILELEFPNVTVVSAAEYAALVPHPPSEIPQIDVTGIVLPEDDDGEHDGDA